MTFIIAESGINHNGDLQEAMRLVVAAKRSGADAVKFQYFDSQRLWGDDRIAQWQLSLKQMQMLKEHADAQGIEFMCTAFDVQGLQEILPLLKRIKISSGCLPRVALLKAADSAGLDVLLSTGMAEPGGIEIVLRYFYHASVTLLHCTSIYPCPVDQVNLLAIQILSNQFGVPVGFSDHTATISVPIAAAALGATVIEKHLTLNRKAVGPDHLSSIEPHDFAAMVHGIRQVEQALGDGIKRIYPEEQKLREVWHARK